MKKYIIGILLSTLFLPSCNEDFLDKRPLADLTAGAFPESPTDAILAVNAVYNSLRIWNIHTGGFPLLDIMSDQATKGSNPGDGTAIAPYDNFTHDATEGSVERWYKTLYQAIRRANLVIEKVPSIEMDEALKTRIVAEARFLRAVFYSDLVRGFGDVPMVLVVDPTLDLGRTPKTTIFDQVIIPDLEFAAQNLPEKFDYAPEDQGRATRGAAKAMMARMYLFFQDFAGAAQYSQEVINSGQYDLEPEFSDAFASDHEHGVESVFEVGALPENFNLGGNQYANTMAIRGAPNRGWGFGRPAYSWIRKMSDQGDPRLDASVIFLGEELDGVVTVGDAATPDTTYAGSQIVEIEAYNQKVWHPGTTTETSFGFNKRVIRYADVLLMAAESLNELAYAAGGEAFEYLNEVRQRAGLPPYTAADLPDQTSFREAVYEERDHELALEGLRFWDLVRTGKAPEVLGPLGFVEGVHELFPIPQSEVDVSEGRISQNFGY